MKPACCSWNLRSGSTYPPSKVKNLRWTTSLNWSIYYTKISKPCFACSIHLHGTFRGPLPADSLPHHDEVYPPLPSNSCIFVCSCNDGRSDKCIRSWAWLSINTVSTTQTAGKSGISRLDPETGFQLQGIEARYEDKLPFGIVSSDLQEHIPCLLRT